jgi:leucyl aminopeptidase
MHTSADVVAYVNFGHVLEHAKMILGFGYELGFAPLPTET